MDSYVHALLIGNRNHGSSKVWFRFPVFRIEEMKRAMQMMRPLKLSISAFLMFMIWNTTLANQSQNISSLVEDEKELAKMANDILRHKDTDHKIAVNKRFINKLTEVLKRPESFNYPFDSLTTISRLKPQDNSFRIFTWYFVDLPNPDAYYAENAHYYFGLIQRKHIDPSGKTHYIVIPLMEIDRLPKGFESVVSDNFAWFGALYYPPKGEKYIPAYQGYYYKLVQKEGTVKENTGEKEQIITYIPGKYKGRTLKEVDKLSYSNHKRVKEGVNYYLLMGWNGWDNKSNYKVMEVLSFDQEDSTRAIFGAPIFYFDQIPKARALFKYSDNSHFSMNMSYVKSGFLKMFKKKMVVYDHLALPNISRGTEKYELGPDGTYDAVAWFGKYGGYFEWYRQVEVAERYQAKQHQKEMLERQMKTAQNDSLTFPDYYKLMSPRQQRKLRKSNKRILTQQKKDADERMKETGLELKRKDED